MGSARILRAPLRILRKDSGGLDRRHLIGRYDQSFQTGSSAREDASPPSRVAATSARGDAGHANPALTLRAGSISIPPMRLSPALLLAFLPASGAFAGKLPDASLDLQSSHDPEIPYGIEAVTGYRSEYIYRGFKLAQQTLDFQLEAEIALANEWFLGVGGWFATETGSGNFEESAGFLELRHESGPWAFGLNTSYHAFQHPVFQDGLDTGLFCTWSPNDDFQFTAGGYYDDGAGAWYGKIEGGWTKPTGHSSFVSVMAGTSWLNDYYGRSGWNDAYARLSWTYGISDRVSITPFLGSSLSLDPGGPGSDYLWGGIWFEVNF